MKMQENEFKKEKAVSDQKIELQNLHINEFQVREDNLKKLNEKIMESMNNMSLQGNNVRQIFLTDFDI